MVISTAESIAAFPVWILLSTTATVFSCLIKRMSHYYCCKLQPLRTEVYFCRQDVFLFVPFRCMRSVLCHQVEENLAASVPNVPGAHRCRSVLIWTQRDLNVSPLLPPCPVWRLGSVTVAATVLMIIVASPRALHMLRWFLVQRRFLHRSGKKKNLLALSFARSELPAVGKK